MASRLSGREPAAASPSRKSSQITSLKRGSSSMARKNRGPRKRGTGASSGQSSSGSGARVRGRPFSKNYDARRNTKGRKRKPERTPLQIIADGLMEKQVVTRSGKRRRMTRLEVMFEQQAVPAMQGDSKGVRGLRTLVCVVKEITVQDPQGDKGMTPVHNVKELDSLFLRGR